MEALSELEQAVSKEVNIKKIVNDIAWILKARISENSRRPSLNSNYKHGDLMKKLGLVTDEGGFLDDYRLTKWLKH